MRLREHRSVARTVSSFLAALVVGVSVLATGASAPPPGEGEPKPLPWKGGSSAHDGSGLQGDLRG